MKIVAGLGNPGAMYECTRHNVGFMVVDLLADRLGVEFSKKQHGAEVADCRFLGEKVLLAKPQTFMNLSGRSLGELVRFYKISLEDLLVVYDDLDLEPGRIRFRPKGGPGGHRGLASIQQVLGTAEVQRLKIGIGRPPVGWQGKDYVLAPFFEEQWTEMQKVLPRAAEAVEQWLKSDINTAMNQYNN